jgi:hypothetical protein
MQAITKLSSTIRFMPRACNAAPLNAPASAISCERSRKTMASPIPATYHSPPTMMQHMKMPMTITAPRWSVPKLVGVTPRG